MSYLTAKKRQNVCLQLFQRAQDGSCIRRDLKILRTLVENKRNQQTWKKVSKHWVGFDCGHVFFDQFRTCYSIWGTRRAPCFVYKLPPCRTTEKIESAVIFESPINQDSFEKCCTSDEKNRGHQACLIGVTADGWLTRRSLNSGEFLQRVFLSSTLKFKHVFWETDLQRIAVKSVHLKSGSENFQNMQSHANAHPRPFLYLAVLEVAPLRFLALIPIEKTIFGQGVVDVSLSTGLLGVMYQSRKMCFFSLDKILEENTHVVQLYENYSPPTNSNHGNMVVDSVGGEQGMVGEYPFGLPVNVSLTSRPPVLFESSSYQHVMSFGGHPWHYIVCPYRGSSVFQVRSLKDDAPVKGGVLETDVLSVEPDQAYFHCDHSGRLLHIGPRAIRCLKLCQILDQGAESTGFELKPCFSLNLECRTENLSSSQQVKFTSSGRRIKQRLNQAYSHPGQETVQAVDYEDELDILVTLSSIECDTGVCGRVGLYDNQTGSLIREIVISKWDEDGDHSIMMERDVIVHVTKSVSRKFTCSVYYLIA